MEEPRVVKLRAESADIGYTKKPRCRSTVVKRESAQESEPSQFVQIMNELTLQWAARRNFPAQKPVHRHLKMVSNGDHRNDTAAIAPGFDTGDRPSAKSDNVSKAILGKASLQP